MPSVRNVLNRTEDPVTYREDVTLEDDWPEEVRSVGLNHCGIKTSSTRVEVAAVVIMQYDLKNCLWQMS